MSRILVAGLVNIETTLRIDAFPLDWFPVTYAFDRIGSSVSGVGANIARALTVLGHDVRFVAMLGDDEAGQLARATLRRWRIADDHVLDALRATPQSVILYDGDGKRQIHVDLKAIQTTSYPHDLFLAALGGCDAAVLCNINFARPFLADTKRAGVPILTDVHVVDSLDDPYNAAFMQAADLLFMSAERLPEPPSSWGTRVLQRYGNTAVVIADGARGAWLFEKGKAEPVHEPAATPPRIVNTIGAGDALCASFLHGVVSGRNAREALRAAVVFAAHKIGSASASEGFMTPGELDDAVQRAG